MQTCRQKEGKSQKRKHQQKNKIKKSNVQKAKTTKYFKSPRGK